jgi:hypothetical protein
MRSSHDAIAFSYFDGTSAAEQIVFVTKSRRPHLVEQALGAGHSVHGFKEGQRAGEYGSWWKNVEGSTLGQVPPGWRENGRLQEHDRCPSQ